MFIAQQHNDHVNDCGVHDDLGLGIHFVYLFLNTFHGIVIFHFLVQHDQ